MHLLPGSSIAAVHALATHSYDKYNTENPVHVGEPKEEKMEEILDNKTGIGSMKRILPCSDDFWGSNFLGLALC